MADELELAFDFCKDDLVTEEEADEEDVRETEGDPDTDVESPPFPRFFPYPHPLTSLYARHVPRVSSQRP